MEKVFRSVYFDPLRYNWGIKLLFGAPMLIGIVAAVIAKNLIIFAIAGFVDVVIAIILMICIKKYKNVFSNDVDVICNECGINVVEINDGSRIFDCEWKSIRSFEYIMEKGEFIKVKLNQINNKAVEFNLFYDYRTIAQHVNDEDSLFNAILMNVKLYNENRCENKIGYKGNFFTTVAAKYTMAGMVISFLILCIVLFVEGAINIIAISLPVILVSLLTVSAQRSNGLAIKNAASKVIE